MTPEAKQRSEHLRIKAQGILTLLASEFGIAVPHLKWQGQQRRGTALIMGNEIRCGPNVWRGVENSVLHEFAHILAYRREGSAARSLRCLVRERRGVEVRVGNRVPGRRPLRSAQGST